MPDLHLIHVKFNPVDEPLASTTVPSPTLASWCQEGGVIYVF